MTFLEWTITKYHGEPHYQQGDGQSEWNCPNCGHSRFHSLPVKPGLKHRAKCWSCGFRGDVADMIRTFELPDATYPDLLDRVEQLRREFEREMPRQALQSFSRGSGGIQTKAYERDPRLDEFSDEADSAIKELLEYLEGYPNEAALRQALLIAKEALNICGRHGLHPVGFAGRCDFVVWYSESDEKRQQKAAEEESRKPVVKIRRAMKKPTPKKKPALKSNRKGR